MIEIVTDGKLITKYQMQFVKRLKTVCNKKIYCNLGFQGDSFTTTVFYSPKSNFWFSAHENDNRYWNAFGVGEPPEGRNTSIHVEINFPYEGINRSIGGAFGHNIKGEILLLHRGIIGGGRVGVGKQLFFDNFRGDFATAYDDGIETEFVVIGSINSKHFPQQVSNFIAEVHRIKNLSTEETAAFSYLSNFKFTDEHFGISTLKRKTTTTIERTHGIVVNSLARILEENGHKIGNDRNRDLYIHKRGQIKSLFEIKTSSSTQDLYSAVGQLLIYSIPIKGPLDLYLVLPDKLSKPVKKRLDKLGLQIIYYTWDNNKPTFLDLDKVI
jgi:hypothetical protein